MNKIQSNKIIDGTNAYKQKNSLVQRWLRKENEKHINDICQRIESSAITNSTKDLHQGVKKLTRNFRPRIDVIKNENKEVLSEGSKVMDGTSYITSIFEFEQEPLPTFSEVEKAMKEIKNGRSPGYDEISAALITNGGDNIIKHFHKLGQDMEREVVAR